MDREDPMDLFFSGHDDVDLYAVLSLESTATVDAIKKAYRRLALMYHPDKHVASSEKARADASLKFQQIGFAYAILSDEKRRSKYDQTGRTDEGFDLQDGEDGWDEYFADLFDKVTKGRLDEYKREYQGSAEEIEDLKRAYGDTDKTISEIVNHIPFSTLDDEPRFIRIISQLIEDGELNPSRSWEKSIEDEKAKLIRKCQAEAEAAEAEQLAKELGVWDEFYGSGKEGPRKAPGKGKAKSKSHADDGEEDHSTLQALILSKQKNLDGFFDNLAAKYAGPVGDTRKKGAKKRAAVGESEALSTGNQRSSASDMDGEKSTRTRRRLQVEKPKQENMSTGKRRGRKTG